MPCVIRRERNHLRGDANAAAATRSVWANSFLNFFYMSSLPSSVILWFCGSTCMVLWFYGLGASFLLTVQDDSLIDKYAA